MHGHFFINITLRFPGRKPIHTYALIDCGASDSCISDRFAYRHSLPRRSKDVAVPILAVDNRPIASGLITQDVVTQLEIDGHSEFLSLAVVAVAYPVILGLDWLRVHNPFIDWADPKLSLSCCSLRSPVTVLPRGSGLVGISQSLNSFQSCSVTSTGLGFGLRASPLSRYPVPEPPPPSSSPSTAPPKPSFLASFTRWTGFGRSSLDISLDSSPSPSVSLCNSARFRKYTKNAPVGIIRRHDSSSPIYLSAMSSSPLDEIDDDKDPPSSDSSPSFADNTSFIPSKYMPWADSVFSDTAVNELPPHRPFDCAIDIEEGKIPPFGPLYRLTQPEQKALAEYIDENLRKGFIRRSSSSASSPILFVRKKTGDLRLCVDYRGLNAITKRNRYPLPHIDDLLDRTQGCKLFTVIDLKNAFNLIRIREGDEWKTAFRTPLGLYEYLVMPFGLTNAPSVFQSFIQDTLRDYIGVFCVVYLDDILIFSRTQEEHDEQVKLVLDRLKDAHLYANPKKCEFDKSEVEYLGYIIGADGIKMNPRKLATIAEWPVPRSTHDVQVFLGFCNFYRRFIDHYALVAHPLHLLTRKDVRFHWSDTERNAFETLKRAFTSYPVLRHYDPSKPATLSTDASNFALSGILQQPDDSGVLHPVAYYSRKITPAESNYDTHDKELLAIVDSFRDMRPWLMGTSQPISVVCDHKNLEYFMTSRVLNPRQARWSTFLSYFDFQLDWAPGIRNPADGPSRRPDYEPKRGDEVLTAQNKALLTPYHLRRIRPELAAQDDTPAAPNTIPAITTLSIDNSELLQRFQKAFREDTEWREAMLRGDSDFTAQDDMVFYKGRVYVPKSLRAEVLYQRHDCVLSGHPGRTSTVKNVERDYCWPGIYTYVRRYVAACDVCARTKIPRHKPYGLLKPLDIPERPWKSISMDFIVKLPKSHGYDSVWVVCDRLTRASHFVPCVEEMSAPDLAWLFIDRIFRYHGLPDSIVSDRGSLFVSNFWKALASRLDMTTRHSTAYHPRTDGLTERTNQTLETYLRAYCSYQQDDWVDYLPLAEFVFNNTENSSTKQTPFFANYAFHPTFSPKLSDLQTVPAADDLAKRLDQIHQELKAELQYAQDRQQKYFNQHVLPSPKYQPDQLVWLLRRNIRTTRPSLKLDHRRLGPYPVVREVGNDSYLLRLPSYLSRLHSVFHSSLLEPYLDPSEFHSHAQPELIELAEDPALAVHSILDCRKVGHRYEYLVHYSNSSSDEDLWIPFSDLPTTSNELIERFHHRHPKSPRPHPLVIHATIQPPSFETIISESIATSSSSSLPIPPSYNPRPHSPKPFVDNPRSFYTPPTSTTLRSGRVSRPHPRNDPR